MGLYLLFLGPFGKVCPLVSFMVFSGRDVVPWCINIFRGREPLRGYFVVLYMLIFLFCVFIFVRFWGVGFIGVYKEGIGIDL